LKEIISTTIESVKAGMKGKECGVSGFIKFELAVVKVKEAGGRFKFLIAEAGGNYSSQTVSKISFGIIGKSAADANTPRMNIWLNES
jgi:hypothetical protein